jgi:hypothetical protein
MQWVVLSSVLALPGIGAANFLLYLGPPDRTPPPDRDTDGLLDSWELTHFGHLAFSAGDDPDHDGIGNADELARGTHPFDPASAAITLFVRADGGEAAYDGLARAWDGAHGPKPSIHAALAISFSGDTVHVLPGTYLEDVDIRGMAVTITGEGTLKGTL